MNQQELELKIAEARRTCTDPHALIEHVIKLYGDEFIKANETIARKNETIAMLEKRWLDSESREVALKDELLKTDGLRKIALQQRDEKIAALEASLKASCEIVQIKERENDELFKIKQRTVIANRELMKRNNELATLNSDLRIRLEQLTDALEGVRFDFSKHEEIRALLQIGLAPCQT